MWDSRIVEKIDVYVGEFVVACSFRSVADDFSWAFAGVLTLTLLEVLSRMSWLAFLLGGSCLGGDFNVTRFLAKRSREVRLNAAIMEFSNLFFRVGPYGSPSCRRDFYLVQ